MWQRIGSLAARFLGGASLYSVACEYLNWILFCIFFWGFYEVCRMFQVGLGFGKA